MKGMNVNHAKKRTDNDILFAKDFAARAPRLDGKVLDNVERALLRASGTRAAVPSSDRTEHATAG